MITRMRAARHLTDFDASVNEVRALSNFHKGKGHKAMSMGPGSRVLADAIAAVPPKRARHALFRAAGFTQGIPLDQVRRLDIDELDAWAADQYGPGPFPVVVIGAASGGAMHLAAALGAPFLPQTTLCSVRDVATDPDRPAEAMRTLAPIAKRIARNNPRIAVYHMHDPAQDRPMLEKMAYMRLKRLRLGVIYERFLTERLAPGGTILRVETNRTWRSTQVDDRVYFQFGCIGGITEDEYFDGSDRITDYLEREDASVQRWEPPEPDGRRPEAEWSWEASIDEDLERLTQLHGFEVRALTAEDAQQHSAFAADLYRWWYRERGLPANRLLVECYAQWDPHWTLRTGSVPYWLKFNTEPSYEGLKSYLEQAEPYEEIYLNPFSRGVESPGVVPLDQWESLIREHAVERGELIGVHRRSYPIDIGGTLRYQRAFKSIKAREPMPDEPLTIEQIDRFAEEARGRYDVEWTSRAAVPA